MIVPIATGVIFVALSVLTYKAELQEGVVSFLMGLIACGAVIMLIATKYKDNKQSPVFEYLARYTMPIFLMHTLFAAPLRALLVKAGIENAAVHVLFGIVISFLGPIVAAEVMRKSKWLEFFLYPGKHVKI